MVKQKMKFSWGILFLLSISVFGQQQINLVDKLQNNEIRAVNRIISQYQEGTVGMNEDNSNGLGILQEVELYRGAVEIELLGENNPGNSFLGIAFNIQNDSTYEAVYFRPFNFVAEEQIRKDHMVQYISHPKFTWEKLRNERTGEYEGEIIPPPNPDDWFRIVVVLSVERVEVYVNDISNPVLVAERLTTVRSGKIGLWTGFGSSGRFRNMVLRD